MKKLKNGWVQGSVQEFLKLSDAEMAQIETKLTLAGLREQRMKLTPRRSKSCTSGQRRAIAGHFSAPLGETEKPLPYFALWP